METESLSFLEIVLAVVMAFVAATVLSGCTGPFGIVMGGERVHELYNRRFQTSYESGFNGFNGTDYHTADERQALQRELDKKRHY